MTNCILIGKTKRIKISSMEDAEFDTKIYDNSGILDPGIKGFIRYDIKEDGVQMIQIYVRPESREDGVGILLLENLQKIAKKNKKRRLFIINASDENDPVHKLFLKAGYKIIAPKLWERILT